MWEIRESIRNTTIKHVNKPTLKFHPTFYWTNDISNHLRRSNDGSNKDIAWRESTQTSIRLLTLRLLIFNFPFDEISPIPASLLILFLFLGEEQMLLRRSFDIFFAKFVLDLVSGHSQVSKVFTFLQIIFDVDSFTFTRNNR